MIFPEKLKNAEGHHIYGEAEWVLEVTAKLLSQDGEGVVMEQSGYPTPKTSTPLTGGGEGQESTTIPSPAVPLTATTLTPLSSATGVRVISDLDDTVSSTRFFVFLPLSLSPSALFTSFALPQINLHSSTFIDFAP